MFLWELVCEFNAHCLHDKLVAMLEKLQVISRLTHDSERILIPCLLPDKIPEDTLFDKHWPLHEDIPQVILNNELFVFKVDETNSIFFFLFQHS